MVLIVGDLHGDWGSLNALMAKKRPDIVLQCGDFGWWPHMEVKKPVIYGQQSVWMLKGLKVPTFTNVYWCDGNHEDHETLDKMTNGLMYPVLCYERVTYQPRGNTLTLPDGRVVLFFGGASSVDKQWRTPGLDWFFRETPNTQEHARALTHAQVDIVISHTCPHEFCPNEYKSDKMNDPTRDMLSNILEKYKPGLWYFGHWHTAKEGKHNNTYWQALDYPKHSGRWWVDLK